MRFNSFSTPKYLESESYDLASQVSKLTVQNSSFGNHLLYMIFSLREDEEDAGNAPLDYFGELSTFVQYSAQYE
jgi:hypothetical protein